MSLLFNILSRLVITFLPQSKHLLISWLQSPSAVILEAPRNKICHCFHCFPIYLPWSDGTRCHDLSFLSTVLFNKWSRSFPLIYDICCIIHHMWSSQVCVAKESTCQCRRHRFDPWVRKILWRRKWLLIVVFLPSESHGQRSLVGYSPWGSKELDITEQLSARTHTHTHTHCIHTVTAALLVSFIHWSHHSVLII